MDAEVTIERTAGRPIPSLIIGVLLLSISTATLLTITFLPHLRDRIYALHHVSPASLLLLMFGGLYLLYCLIPNVKWQLLIQRSTAIAIILFSVLLLYALSQGITLPVFEQLPASNSVVAFMIAGCAALLNPGVRSLSQLTTVFLLILIVTALAIFGLTAYELGYEPFFRLSVNRHMSPPTAICLLLLAIGLSYTTWWRHRNKSFDPVGGITILSSILLIFAALVGAGLIYSVSSAYLHYESRNTLIDLLSERSTRIVEHLQQAEVVAELLNDEAIQANVHLPTHISYSDYAQAITDKDGRLIDAHNAEWLIGDTGSAIKAGRALLWRGKHGLSQLRISNIVGNRVIETSVPFDLSPMLDASRDDANDSAIILCGYQANNELRCLSQDGQPHPDPAKLLVNYKEAPDQRDNKPRLYASNDGILAVMTIPEYGLTTYMHKDNRQIFGPIYSRLYFVLPLALFLLSANIGLIAWRIHPLAKQLHRNEKLYRSLVDGAADAILLQDNKRRFIQVNPAASRLFGLSKNELIGMHPNDFLMAEDQEDALNQVKKLQHKHTMINDRRTLRVRNGETVNVEIRATALDTGEIISIVRDISEQERNEAALREKEQFTRSVVEVLAEGVIVFQIDGVIAYTNRAALSILAQNDLVAAKATLDVKHWSIIRQDLTPFNNTDLPYIRSLNDGVSLRNIIMGVMRPDGARIWISLNSDPLKDERCGTIIGAVASFSDITKKRETEHALFLSRERLRGLSNHLQKVREEEKSAIAREIHDELGSSLSAIKMGIEWIALRSTDMPVELHERASHISAVTDRAIQATRRLVTQLRPSLLEDLGLWPALEWLMRELATNSGLEVTHHFHCTDIPLQPQTALAIYRVVQEALNNIAKHAHASKVHLDCWVSDEVLHIALEDNGIGIDDEVKLRISSYGIRGMYERIGQVHGHLQILGTQGEGTLIAVSIPLTPAININEEE